MNKVCRPKQNATRHQAIHSSLLILLIGFSLCANAQTITTAAFEPKVDFAAGAYPRGIVVADIDNNGKNDLAVVNNNGSTFSIFKNTSTPGTIMLAAPVDYAVGTNPMAIAVGNLDGNGQLEVVVANYGSNTVSVFQNNGSQGSISFAPRVDFTTGLNPISVLLTDVDGDARIDIVAVNNNGNSVSVLRNLTAGGVVSFAAKVDFPVGNWPQLGASADLDGDGRIDLAVPNFNSNTVSVLRNLSSPGSIAFAPKADFATGTSPFGCAIRDLDADGKHELIVTNSAAQSVSVYKNTSTPGTLSLLPKTDFATNGSPLWVSVGDIDGDGKPELVTANFSTSNVSVLQNTSAAGISFAPKVDFATGTLCRNVGIGDIDGDGKPDLSTANSTANSVSVLRNAHPMAALVNVCAGGNILLASPTNGTAYQWQVDAGAGFTNLANGANTNGVASGNLQLIAVPSSWNGYQFRCLVDGTASVVFRLTVTAPLVPAVTITSTGNYSCAGNAITFTAAATNSGNAPIYQWKKNGVNVGANTNVYATSGLAVGDAIRCDLTGSGPCISTVTVNSNVITIAAAGIINTVAGTSTAVLGDGGPAVAANLSAPRDVCLDGQGNVYIVDENNHRIRRVDAGTGLISTVTGNGIWGSSGDGGLAANAQVAYPQGICIDPAGNLYIADAAGNRVRKIDKATGIITTIAGTGLQAVGADNIQATASQLRVPTSVCLDGANNLYIADRDNHRIRKVNLATGIIVTIAGNAGSASFSGDGGAAINATLNMPDGLSVSPSGDLYFCDVLNSRIRKIALPSGVITTVAGNGSMSFSGDGGPATAAGIDKCPKLCFDAAGNLYLSDIIHARIRKVDAATGIITTIAGTGAYFPLGDGGPALNAGLMFPSGITVWGGSIYFTDEGTNRVRKFSVPLNTAGLPAVAATVTQACAGSPVTLSITAGSLNDATSWRWYSSSCGGTALGTGNLLTVTPAATTTYYVRGEGACVAPGSCGTQTITVSQPVTPTVSVTANPSGALCQGSSVTFTAVATNAGATPVFRWKKNGIATGTNSASFTSASLLNGDVISCELTSTALCAAPATVTGNNIVMAVTANPSGSIMPATAEICAGTTQLFSATGGTGYQWLLNGVAISGANAATYTASVAGQYTVQLTSNGCTSPATNTATLTVAPTPSGTVIPGAATICSGGSQTLTANGGNGYQWYRNGTPVPGAAAASYAATAAGTYTVLLLNATCSQMASNAAIISVSATPVGSISPAAASICSGSSAALAASGGTSYQWFLNGSAIPGATEDIYNAAQAGSYTVVINNATCPGPAANAALVDVKPLPTGNVSPSSGAMCTGQAILLTATGGYSYQWRLNGSPITGATNAAYSAVQPGTYDVLLSDGSCTASSSTRATLIKAGEIKGERYPVVRVAAGQPWPLQARIIGQNYLWNPAIDLSSATISNPVVTASQNRLYTVVITSPLSCPVTDTVTVDVFRNPAVYVPSAFTPNGDGRNELLRPVLVHLKDIVGFKVMNRWGETVFETRTAGDGWNGMYKGRAQPTGTYVWLFEGRDVYGNVIREKGVSTLIR